MIKTLLKQLIIEECINSLFDNIQVNFTYLSDKFEFFTEEYSTKEHSNLTFKNEVFNVCALKVRTFDKNKQKYQTFYLSSNAAYGNTFKKVVFHTDHAKFIFLKLYVDNNYKRIYEIDKLNREKMKEHLLII